jgi:hypothetical protein
MEIELLAASISGPLGDDVRALSPAEQAAVGRLRRPDARRAHVAGRSIVRRHLAGHSTLALADVPVNVDPNGRPTSPFGPCFSIAHGGDLVVVAFARSAVGVDVEPLTAVDDVDLLIDLCGSPPERAVLRSLPRPDRDAAFLAAWVRKEAVLKACGVGIGGGDLAAVDSLLDVVLIDGRPWRVISLPLLCVGYAAAVAVAYEIQSPPNVRVVRADFPDRLEAVS